MIYDVVGDKVILEGCEFTIGERIMATSGNYAGLKGCITEKTYVREIIVNIT